MTARAPGDLAATGASCSPLTMIDLFAGLGGASRAMRERGWSVHRVDAAPDLPVETIADLHTWEPPDSLVHPDLVWASPPCDEFSLARAPKDRPVEPSTALLTATLRIIDRLQPRWWVVENVRGAIKFFSRYLGTFVQSHGPVFLWGEFPFFSAKVAAYKMGISGYDGGRRRAVTPYVISEQLALACERVAASAPTHRPAISPLVLARARGELVESSTGAERRQLGLAIAE